MVFCSVRQAEIWNANFKYYAIRLQYSGYDTQNAISTVEHTLIYPANIEMNMELFILSSGEEPYLKRKRKLIVCDIFLSD